MRQIIRVIRHFLREKRWWHLPRYTFGSSSGGVIALELPLRFPFQVLPAAPLQQPDHVCGSRASWFLLGISSFISAVRSAAASSCKGSVMRCRAAVLKVKHQLSAPGAASASAAAPSWQGFLWARLPLCFPCGCSPQALHPQPRSHC